MQASLLFFFLQYFKMMPPIKELSSVNNRIQESNAAAERVFEILDTEPAIKNVQSPVSISEFNNKIEFQNVSFHFEDDTELVFDNINLTGER